MKFLAKVVYFSRKHENLINGKIEELPEGNTKIVAIKIAKMIHSDAIELSPVTNYPRGYFEAVEVAEKEKRDQLRPLFHKLSDQLKEEKHLFLDFPNWCGGMPKIVVNFLKTYYMKEKIIYPFCTHEGSAFGNSLFELKELCSEAKIMVGLPVRGSNAYKADDSIKNWLVQYQKNGGMENGKK